VIISLRDLSCASFRFGQVALHLFLDKERDFWGRRTPSSSLRKSPQRPKPPFYFFGKKRKAHKKSFLHSILALHQRGSFQNKHRHTHKREEERKKEREGIKARRRRRRGKQRADRYTERKYVWISVSEKVTN
jgi:hypothetical protein